MNQRKDPKTGKFYVDPIKQKWFNNPNFRLARCSCRRQAKNHRQHHAGRGFPLYEAESPGSLWFDKGLKHFPQDLKLAASLLKQGGFVLHDDGLYDADGHRVEFTLQTQRRQQQSRRLLRDGGK